MRVLVLVKNNDVSDQDFVPTPEVLESMKAMGRFNDELRLAGILIDCDGLKPSSYGKRVAFNGPNRTAQPDRGFEQAGKSRESAGKAGNQGLQGIRAYRDWFEQIRG